MFGYGIYDNQNMKHLDNAENVKNWCMFTDKQNNIKFVSKWYPVTGLWLFSGDENRKIE